MTVTREAARHLVHDESTIFVDYDMSSLCISEGHEPWIYFLN